MCIMFQCFWTEILHLFLDSLLPDFQKKEKQNKPPQVYCFLLETLCDFL